MWKLSVALLCVFIMNLPVTKSASGVVVCYYPSYSSKILPPNDIDVNICTHINYAFMGINEDGTLRLEGDENLLHDLSSLKKKNANLKVLISIGGWSDAKNFSIVAASDEKKQTFVEDSLAKLQKYNLDGIDIDWEYPARLKNLEDKANFVDMCRKLKNKFKNYGYLVTAALWSNASDNAYDVPALSDILDLMNIMLYDLHSSTEKATGENAPLYGSSYDTPYQRQYCNCNVSIHRWLEKGADPSKVTFGLAFYGRTFTLADPDKYYVGAPAIGPGKSGSSMTYGKICQLDWEEAWDNETQVPYKHKSDQWVGYDNPTSIHLKVKYLRSQQLAGVMIWTIAQDDLEGNCGRKNSLLQTVKEALY